MVEFAAPPPAFPVLVSSHNPCINNSLAPSVSDRCGIRKQQTCRPVCLCFPSSFFVSQRDAFPSPLPPSLQFAQALGRLFLGCRNVSWFKRRLAQPFLREAGMEKRLFRAPCKRDAPRHLAL